jgi:hypothetical protein
MAHPKQLVWLLEDHSGILDTVGKDKLTTCYKKTMQEVKAEEPGAKLMSLDRAAALIQRQQRTKYCTGWQEITREKYWYALEVLPPNDWQGLGTGAESFKMCELLCGDITGIYVQLGTTEGNSRYFTCNESQYARHSKLVASAERYAAANPMVSA